MANSDIRKPTDTTVDTTECRIECWCGERFSSKAAVISHAKESHDGIICKDEHNIWNAVIDSKGGFVVCRECEYSQWSKSISSVLSKIYQHCHSHEVMDTDSCFVSNLATTSTNSKKVLHV